MIAQAIVALLQHASEIDRATGRSCFLYRATADNFLLGFRRLPTPTRRSSRGDRVRDPTFWPPYRRPSFSRHGQRARHAKKYLKGGPAARRGL
jgi:hypothetical protein